MGNDYGDLTKMHLPYFKGKELKGENLSSIMKLRKKYGNKLMWIGGEIVFNGGDTVEIIYHISDTETNKATGIFCGTATVAGYDFIVLEDISINIMLITSYKILERNMDFINDESKFLDKYYKSEKDKSSEKFIN